MPVGVSGPGLATAVSQGAENRVGSMSSEGFEACLSQSSSLTCPLTHPDLPSKPDCWPKARHFKVLATKTIIIRNNNPNIFPLKKNCAFTCFFKCFHIFYLQQPQEIDGIKHQEKQLLIRSLELMGVEAFMGV